MRQAAEQVGVSRQTMFRYIKEGRVSATLSHSGSKQIEVTELLRAFGTLQAETVTSTTHSDRSRQSHSDSMTSMSVTYQIELERLKAQLTLKTAELELAKERISELKDREHEATNEKNRFLTLIEQQSRLLAAPPKGRATPTKNSSTAAKRSAPTKRTTAPTKLSLQKIAEPVEKKEAKPKKNNLLKVKATSKTKKSMKNAK